MMHYTGRAFRPPFEENSLLLQVSTGCSHNKCAFCSMYRDEPFAPSPMEDVESDIKFIGRNRTLFKRVFLVGGDPFVLPFERLKRIGELINEHIPRIEVIGCYATIPSILRKTPEQLRELAKLGYSNLNIGLESGLDDVLSFMNKGFTVAEAREALLRLNDAGISYTLNLIHGVAGAGRGLENALADAAIVNEVQPKLIIVTVLYVTWCEELAALVERGEFTPATLREDIEEEMAFLRATDLTDTFFFGMHEVCPVRVNGFLPADRDFLVGELEASLARFPEHQLDSPIRELRQA
ncbi:MAG: radical SAM protein [Eggerthellaceae bacterium]|nr:radical SAM protein [Eggerthellaceae bacterium]